MPTPVRKSVFTSITPTALRDIEQAVARGPPGMPIDHIISVVGTLSNNTQPTTKRPVDIDAIMSPAKKQAAYTAQDYVVPLNDRVPARRSGRKSSWMPSNMRGSSFASNSFLDQPPPNVKPSDYYLYTPSRVPDPLRIRQVLAWCARNVTDRQGKMGREGVIDSKAAAAATHIQDTLIKSLLNGQINTSWYHRPVARRNSETGPSPNPVNVKNTKILQKWSSIIENFEAEDRVWNQTAAKYSAMHAKALDATMEDGNQISAKWHTSWLEALSPIEQQFLNHHCLHDEGSQVLDLIDHAVVDLQAKVDLIEHTTSNAMSHIKNTDNAANEILKTLSFNLNRKLNAPHPQDHALDGKSLSPDPSLLLRIISSNKK
ncbi:hypothetical protein INT44_002650 [Umbelopsis vinacea]|uniref:Uncharacterized protein n=1 Tax=Umbelopsis vinacea TaxID=44442 RepID=A0A8H7PEW3_9FUNG|nr:hypothetical protein INT44_002650 [Umbelopsis vinacea]